jgi:WD40 repeat protein
MIVVGYYHAISDPKSNLIELRVIQKRTMDQLFIVPFRRNPRFVGREEQLEQLHQQLQGQHTAGITGLTGMGGIGKTQLAVEYVYRAHERSDYPDGIFWLNGARLLRAEFAQLGRELRSAMPAGTKGPVRANTITRLHRMLDEWFNKEEFRSLCLTLNVKYDDLPGEGLTNQTRELVLLMDRQGRLTKLETAIRLARPNATLWRQAEDVNLNQEEEIRLALDYLQSQHQALLIIDNLEDLNHLDQPLHRNIAPADLPCSLLFTSRQTYTLQWHSLNLNVLPEAAALELLLSDLRRQPVLVQSDSDEHEAACSICDILGCLPLAVETAAVHLINHFPIPIAHYRDELLKRGALPVLDDPRAGQVVTLDERHRVGLAATLQSQWDSLTETGAKEVLLVAGQFLEAAVIPIPRLGLLAGLPAKGKSFFDMTIGQAVQKLLDASLMERLQEEQVRLHPLVREFAQQQSSDPDQFRLLCAGRLLAAYEDFTILEAHCIRRGIVAILEDLRATLELISQHSHQNPANNQQQSLLSDHHFPLSNQLQTLLRFLQLEAHTILNWNALHQPALFAQQLFKRACELNLKKFRLAAHQLLQQKSPPYWYLNWAAKSESLALQKTLTGPNKQINDLAITPNSETIVTSHQNGSLTLWDLKTGLIRQTIISHDAQRVQSVAITPDGRRIISGAEDGKVKVWDLHTGRLMNSFSIHEEWVNDLVVILDGKHVVSGSGDTTIKVWQIETGHVEQIFRDHDRFVLAVAITEDGKWVASGSVDGLLKLWNLKTGQLEKSFMAHTDRITSLTIIDDLNQIFSGSWDGTIKVWNLASGELEYTLHDPGTKILALAKLPDGSHIVSTSSDETVKVWNIQTGKVEQTFYGHQTWVNTLTISPDGNQAISACLDGIIKIWDLTRKQAETRLFGHPDRVNAMAFYPDGHHAISVSGDHTLKIWDIRTGEEAKLLEGHKDAVNDIVVLPDSHYAVSASRDKTAILWNLQTGIIEQILSGHQGGVNTVAISSDGKHVFSGSTDDTVKVWSLATGELEQTLSGHQGGVNCVTIHSKDDFLITGAGDNTLKVWDWRTGKIEQTLAGHSQSVQTVTAIPNTHLAASASQDSAITIWNILTGQAEKSFMDHSDDGIRSIAITPNGNYIISASLDHTLKVWDVFKETAIVSITLDGPVWAVAISPDGETVLAGDQGGNVYCLRLVLGGKRI